MTSAEYKEHLEGKMSESEIQIAFTKWLNSLNIYFEIGLEGMFLPNPHRKGTKAWSIQARANKGVLNKLKREGMKKGPADVKVYLRDLVVHVELKTLKKGVQSQEQKKVEEQINKYKYANYHVCRGIASAKSTIEKYINEGK